MTTPHQEDNVYMNQIASLPIKDSLSVVAIDTPRLPQLLIGQQVSPHLGAMNAALQGRLSLLVLQVHVCTP